MNPFSLYIHIPYCFHKCPYCDFNVHAVRTAPEEDYKKSLLSELQYRATLPEWKGRPLQSIFFGGGTPSILLPETIQQILEAAFVVFPSGDFRQIEISLEANPGTVTIETLKGYREAGVNRLSIGTQSFQPALLKSLGRVHSPEQTDAAVRNARDAGFANINLDLMFGVPEQTPALLQKDIDHAFSLKPEHISTYGLTIEKGTPFYQAFQRGALPLPPEDSVLEMMDILETSLDRAGFQHYEISNYALPGKQVIHNLAYWNSDDYLGIGAGAHSYLGSSQNEKHAWGHRWSNFAAPERYMKESNTTGNAESWSDSLSCEGAMFEYFFLGLRKLAGVSLSQFDRRFPFSVQDLYSSVIEELQSQGFVQLHGDLLSLTRQGVRLADSVIARFILDEPYVK